MSQKSQVNELGQQDYDVTITGRHVEVTEAMKQYALDKLSKVERFHANVIDLNVTMDIQKLDHKVDIIIKFNHFKIKLQAVSDNMYTAIDKVVSKLQAQLRKYKDKLQKHHAKGVSAVDMQVNVVRRPAGKDELEDINEEIEEENLQQLEEHYRPHEIVKKETRPLKILTYDEAIMKMELSQDSFLVFRGEDDQGIKVIYRREDGNYGIIHPENS